MGGNPSSRSTNIPEGDSSKSCKQTDGHTADRAENISSPSISLAEVITEIFILQPLELITQEVIYQNLRKCGVKLSQCIFRFEKYTIIFLFTNKQSLWHRGIGHKAKEI